MDEKNIIEIENILKNISIKEFWLNNFKGFDYFNKIKKNYFSIYISNDFSYLKYKSFNYEKAIRR